MVSTTKAILAIALIVGGAALVWVARPKRKSLPKLARGQRLALIGDSLGIGLRKPLEGFAAGKGITFNASVESGTRIAQWARSPNRLSEIERFAPDVVLVSLGTNDAVLLSPLDEADELELLVRRLGEMGARVVWLEPPAGESLPRMPEVRAMIRGSLALAEAGGSVLDPTGEKFDEAPDGVHLTGRGYEKWGRWIWTRIANGAEA